MQFFVSIMYAIADCNFARVSVISSFYEIDKTQETNIIRIYCQHKIEVICCNLHENLSEVFNYKTSPMDDYRIINIHSFDWYSLHAVLLYRY